MATFEIFYPRLFQRKCNICDVIDRGWVPHEERKISIGTLLWFRQRIFRNVSVNIQDSK